MHIRVRRGAALPFGAALATALIIGTAGCGGTGSGSPDVPPSPDPVSTEPDSSLEPSNTDDESADSDSDNDNDNLNGGDPGISEVPDPPIDSAGAEPQAPGITPGIPASPLPGCDDTPAFGETAEPPALCRIQPSSSTSTEPDFAPEPTPTES
ncbi:hypothetical protein [Streptomyces sp. NPDC046925]|uniref:hypothetical protein n=1 Tax=Streptomyces sp. NPDC046925 TaxID=3155375 RepID=UPI0033FD5AA4